MTRVSSAPVLPQPEAPPSAHVEPKHSRRCSPTRAEQKRSSLKTRARPHETRDFVPHQRRQPLPTTVPYRELLTQFARCFSTKAISRAQRFSVDPPDVSRAKCELQV